MQSFGNRLSDAATLALRFFQSLEIDLAQFSASGSLCRGLKPIVGVCFVLLLAVPIFLWRRDPFALAYRLVNAGFGSQ